MLLFSSMVVGVSCSTPDASRQGWLTQQLVDDNWYLFERDPELLRGKFRKMASGLYNYFRGTTRIYLADISRAGALSHPTKFGTAASAYIATVTDPHPENIGTYYSGKGIRTVDFNDFDGSTYAPYYLDVRRLTVGFAILAIQVSLDKQKSLFARLLRRVSEGYVEQINQLLDKKKLRIRYRSGFGTILDDLLRRAWEQGAEQRNLNEYTRIKDGKRSLYFGSIEASDVRGVYRKEVTSLPEKEWLRLQQIMQRYQKTRLDQGNQPAGYFAIKGASKRFGSGVSSYPKLRYYVLLEGPTSKPDDDLLLECKELGDASPLPEFFYWRKQQFRNNGERVVWMQRNLQEFQDNDIHLGWSALGTSVYRVRHFTSYQKGFSASRFREKYSDKKWSAQDLIDYAYQAGRLLAQAHTRAPMLNEAPALPAIYNALKDRGSEFVQETLQFALQYSQQTVEDYKLFQIILQERGPLLGYRPPATLYRQQW